MTAPPDLGKIAERLRELSLDLDQQTGDAERLDRTAVERQHDYLIGYARAFLSSEGAMDVRKQKAVLATAQQRLDAEIAEAQLRACKARISTIKVQIDTGRSLGAALRAEVSLAGSGWQT
jgi:hypothetical protein